MARYLLLGNLAMVVGAMECIKYHCSYPMLPPGVCVDRSNDTYSLYPCGEDLPYCPMDFYGERSACEKAPLPPVLPAYIGDSCSSTRPCVLGSCLSSICTGAPLYASCFSHSDCAPALRCESKKCVPILRIGDWGCLSDEDCELMAGCVGLQGSRNGTCVRYFSIRDGGVVTNCQGNQSLLCESGFCLSSGNHYPKFNCIRPPSSLFPLPVRCNLDSDCLGYTKPWDFASSCQCGFNEPGYAYCSLFPGDSPSLKVTNFLKEFAERISINQCNTARRWEDDCLRRVSLPLFEEYYISRLHQDWYPQLQFNDKCVKEIVTVAYWSSAGVTLAAIWVINV